VTPIALTFSRHQPFLGAILAGEFTNSALFQLKSKGFSILYVPYQSILHAFQEIGIDASSEDGVGGTTETQFRRKINKWKSLPQPKTTQQLLNSIHRLHRTDIDSFNTHLDATITRRVTSVCLTVLYGQSVEYVSIEGAITYLIEEEKSYWLREVGDKREIFEVQVRFSTNTKIDASFRKRLEAIQFLQSFL